MTDTNPRKLETKQCYAMETGSGSGCVKRVHRRLPVISYEGRSNGTRRGMVRGFVSTGWPGGKSARHDAGTATMQENVTT